MKRAIAKSVLALAATAGVFSMPATAKADYRDHHRCDTRRVWVEPVYETRCNRFWVEPAYETRCVPVFVNGYYKTVCDRVWVEPAYEYRNTFRYDHCGRRVCTRERVCVRAGYWRNVERQEWVPPHYRNQNQQVCVRQGHWETRDERVCVRQGYWQTVACDHRSHSHGGGNVVIRLPAPPNPFDPLGIFR